MDKIIKALKNDLHLTDGEISLRMDLPIWEVRRKLYEHVTPLCNDARDEINALYIDEEASVVARRYRTTPSQVHAAWHGSKQSTQPDAEKVKTYYDMGHRLTDIATLCDTTRYKVIKSLREQGITVQSKFRRRLPKHLKEVRDAEILRTLKENSYTHEEIAVMFDVQRSHVSHMNPERKKRPSEAVKERAKEMYEDGYNITEISHALDLTRATIYRWLK